MEDIRIVEWKRFPIYDKLEVNALGEVRWVGGSSRTFQVAKDKDGIAYVQFDGSRMRVASAVAELFVPNPHQYKFKKYIDGDKRNCKASNLFWCKSSYSKYEPETT